MSNSRVYKHIYTSNGSLTIPPGIRYVTITGCGGGGGGGGGAPGVLPDISGGLPPTVTYYYPSSGGGGGAAYTESFILDIPVSSNLNTLSFTIGNGGNGGTLSTGYYNGFDGGDTILNLNGTTLYTFNGAQAGYGGYRYNTIQNSPIILGGFSNKNMNINFQKVIKPTIADPSYIHLYSQSGRGGYGVSTAIQFPSCQGFPIGAGKSGNAGVNGINNGAFNAGGGGGGGATSNNFSSQGGKGGDGSSTFTFTTPNDGTDGQDGVFGGGGGGGGSGGVYAVVVGPSLVFSGISNGGNGGKGGNGFIEISWIG